MKVLPWESQGLQITNQRKTSEGSKQAISRAVETLKLGGDGTLDGDGISDEGTAP